MKKRQSMRRCGIGFFCAVVTFGVPLAGCDDGGGSGGGTGGTGTGGSSGTAGSGAASGAAGASSGGAGGTAGSASGGAGGTAGSGATAGAGGAGVSSCLQGTWECTLPSGSAVITISGNTLTGKFTEGSFTADVMSTLSLSGDTVTIVDTGGTVPCKPSDPGVYTVACQTSSLKLTQVSDDCGGRSKYMSGCTWSRK